MAYSAFFLYLTRKMKNGVHYPGIEPVLQEWESSMIPLHQQKKGRFCVFVWEKKSLNYAYFDISRYTCMLHLDVLLQSIRKELGRTLLDGLFGATYSWALFHYCWMRGLLLFFAIFLGGKRNYTFTTTNAWGRAIFFWIPSVNICNIDHSYFRELP